MTKEETFNYFMDLITNMQGDKEIFQDNLSYFIERYYDTPRWGNMAERAETLIKAGDLVGLSLYLFKAVQNYRKVLYDM